MIKTTNKYEHPMMQTIKEADFSKQPDLSPIDVTAVARYIGVGLNEHNQQTMLEALRVACNIFEERYQRSIILKTMVYTHQRDEAILPKSPVRRILTVELKEGPKWRKIYEATPTLKEYPEVEPLILKDQTSELVVIKPAEYGMLRIALKGGIERNKTVLRVTYEAGHKHTDENIKLPGGPMMTLLRMTKEIFYHQFKEEDDQSEATLYPSIKGGKII